MSKIILFNMISIDGFFEGPEKELDWHNVDAEFNEFAIEQLGSASAIIFGRVTYEMMAAYWTSTSAFKDDPVVADKMNSLPKIVFSKSLSWAKWNNTTVYRGDPEYECKRLKLQSDKDLYIFGSANLASTLMSSGLIDEYRIMINPVILGKGNPFFKSSDTSQSLKLIKTRTFRSGNILLYYNKK
jgi:dihydrofolate reductase